MRTQEENAPDPGSWSLVDTGNVHVFMPIVKEVSKYIFDGFVIIENGHIVNANERMLEITGYSEDELLGSEFIKILTKDSRMDCISAFSKGATSPEKRIPLTGIVLTSNRGRRLHATMNAGWISAAGRELIWVLLRDVTREERLKKMIKEETLKFREFFDCSLTGILYISPRGAILESNEFASEITGYSREEINGSLFTDFVAEHEIPKLEKEFNRLYSENEDIKSECVIRTRTGENPTIEYNARAIRRKGHTAGALMLFYDITEKKALENELLEKNAENERGLWEMAEVKDSLEARAGELNRATEELKTLNEKLNLLSITDGLTEIYNHRYFQERLDEEIARLHRLKQKDGCISLLMLDIDDFKKFNDTYGHQSGDTILKQLATVMKSSTRTIDIIARYGGEEFAIILPHTNSREACLVASRICHSVRSRPFSIDHGAESVNVTVSIGVGMLENGSGTKSDLIGMADDALYRAKKNGKDRVEIWDN